ncbi:MAG: rhomboid family intramembrane serine protease [Armatimonadetes bacterium]|nr:rhomboid family intramembrane serine protease [Armatimonadota bacterium]
MRGRPVVSWILIALTGALALVLQAMQLTGRANAVTAIVNALGISAVAPHAWSPLTYMLVHVGLAHFLVNAFYLWVFGSGVEDAVGWKRMLAIFMIGGAAGGILQWAFGALTLAPEQRGMPIVGASAGCAALMGAFSLRYYRARLSLIGIPWKPHVVSVISLLLFLEMAGGLYSVLHGEQATGVAHWAHVGGFLIGLIVARMLHLQQQAGNSYLQEDAEKALAAGSPAAAIRRLDRVLAQAPNDIQATSALVPAWLALGDERAAAEALAKAQKMLLDRGSRAEAARLWAASTPACELLLRRNPGAILTPREWQILAAGLEEREEFSAAAQILEQGAMSWSDAADAEPALIKAITLYTYQLHRRPEARILMAHFTRRFPHSPWRAHAEALERELQNGSANEPGR